MEKNKDLISVALGSYIVELEKLGVPQETTHSALENLLAIFNRATEEVAS